MYGNPYANQNVTMMNAQVGQMQMAGMGMLGNMGMGTGMFFYTGNTVGLESRL